MSNTLLARFKRASRWLPALLLPFAAQAQLNYAPFNAVNTTTTYTDLAATGTAIATANTDDANSAAQPIGFTFNFNGTAFTQFVLNTNGYLKLGATAPVAPFFGAGPQTVTGGPLNSTDTNLVLPFNFDLEAGNGAGGAEYRVATTGTAPARITTIQWKNVSPKSLPVTTGSATIIAKQFLTMDFQVRLYEGSNTVEFVYGTAVASTNPTDAQWAVSGLKGSGAASGQNVLAQKLSAAAWSATGFITGAYSAANAFNIRQNSLPDAGRTFRFVLSLANDATVTQLYTQGQLATFSPAHVVRARVTNVGSAAYTGTATLTVSRGATALFTTTQPVTALAAGATTTVAFAAYDAATMANVGTNDVTVSLGSDDNNANNTLALDQVVSATTVNYASPAVATPGILSFGAAGVGNVGSRFTTTAARLVTSIQAYIANGAGTAAGVLFDGTGVELGRSAARTLVAADAGTLVTFTLTTPVNIGAGDFLAGLNLTGGASLGSQAEVPTRTATFYQINPGPALVDLASSNLGRFNLGAVTAASTSSCFAVTGLAVGSITPTGASVSFTVPTAGTSYTITYTPTGGTATTVTPAPTASPVVLTGLAANTAYTVTVTTNCAAGAASGTVSATFRTLPTPPANDDCTAATVLPVAAACTPVSTTSTGATASPATVPAATCGTAGPDVWYALTVPANGALTVTTSAPTGTGTPVTDTILQLYSGTCGALALVPDGCDDDSGPGLYSEVTVTGLTAGTVIYARVFGFLNSTGDFSICAKTVTCFPVTNLAVTGITTTGASIGFTAPASGTSYTITYTPTGGTATTVTPAPTASPVVLTGLTAGTTYTVAVTTNCTAGATSITVSTSFTTLTPPAPYAALPVNESFEGTWLNGSSTRDLPGTNWRNSPATGSASWRRDDDGASAAWAFATSGSYTPAASQGARSARFHSYGALAGATGSLDLYVNLSGAAGTRTLTFDYVNPTSSTTNPADKLDVLVSTDGGATFAAAPVLTATNNATFTAKTVVIPSTSATTVIRFRALSDFGNDDIGIDNVQLRVVSATRNEALAATVALYPNPASRAFTLDVPAGSLRTATAALTNALGQVVQTRALSATGTTTFDVSGLAAGVYALTLKSGNDLVVKRVVVE